MRIEDVGGEMERVARRAEEKVLGGAAASLEKGVRDVEQVLGELGWKVVEADRDTSEKSRL